MDSEFQKARERIERDLSDFRTSRLHQQARLIGRRGVVPIQFDRQVDEFEFSGGGGGAPFTFPFQITDGTVTPGSPLAAVNYGTLQDMVPTGGVGSTIALSSGAGTYTLYLDVTVDINGNITAVSLNASTSGQPSNTDYDYYITIGQVVVDSTPKITSIMQAATHSLRFGIAGRAVVSGSLVSGGTGEFWGF